MESSYIYPKSFVVLVAGTMMLICGLAVVGAMIPILSSDSADNGQAHRIGQAAQPTVERVFSGTGSAG